MGDTGGTGHAGHVKGLFQENHLLSEWNPFGRGGAVRGMPELVRKEIPHPWGVSTA